MDLPGGGGLATEAAYNAAKELAENWAVAIADGYALNELVGDVNETIGYLRDWQQEVTGNTKICPPAKT